MQEAEEENTMTTSNRNTVVVGVDGTEDGHRALLYAVTELVTREDLSLRLVHVPRGAAALAPYVQPGKVREIGESVLQDAAKQAQDAGLDATRVTTVLTESPHPSAVLDHVEDARYLVLGTRASGVQHLLAGATSLWLVAHSPVPVHCVPRTWAGSRNPTGRVVAGVDGSDAGRDVLQEAFAEAAARGASLEIVHAWRPESPYDAAITARVLRDKWEEATRAALTRTIQEVAAAHPGVDWNLRLEYQRVPAALYEQSLDADLLVLGRHGGYAPVGLMVGSNTRSLLRNATCPVVVVPVRSPSE
jgi:nucleotide-binding universal stress UspA family protein